MNTRYGWTPDLPDARDRKASDAPHLQHFTPPQRIDMRAKCPPVYDQGQLGSCTANAIAAAIDFERARQGLPFITPSRLFIYYNARLEEGTVDSDSGAMIRDGIKSVAKFGDCPESEWTYSDDAAAFKVQPSSAAYADALKYKALDYWRVPRDLMQMRGCLAAGYGAVIGFSVYESFETDAVAHDGLVPLPKPDENLLGGHAVFVVGYDDMKPMVAGAAPGCLIGRSSWDSMWGDGGYFYLPYAYFTNPDLSDDFWTIKLEAAQ